MVTFRLQVVGWTVQMFVELLWKIIKLLEIKNLDSASLDLHNCAIVIVGFWRRTFKSIRQYLGQVSTDKDGRPRTVHLSMRTTGQNFSSDISWKESDGMPRQTKIIIFRWTFDDGPFTHRQIQTTDHDNLWGVDKVIGRADGQVDGSASLEAWSSLSF